MELSSGERQVSLEGPRRSQEGIWENLGTDWAASIPGEGPIGARGDSSETKPRLRDEAAKGK